MTEKWRDKETDRRTVSKTERGAIKMLFVEHRINIISREVLNDSAAAAARASYVKGVTINRD